MVLIFLQIIISIFQVESDEENIPSNQIANPSSNPQSSQSITGLTLAVRGLPCSLSNRSPEVIEPSYYVLTPPAQAPVTTSSLAYLPSPVETTILDTIPVQPSGSAATNIALTSTQIQPSIKRGRPLGSKNKSKSSAGTQPTQNKRRKH